MAEISEDVCSYVSRLLFVTLQIISRIGGNRNGSCSSIHPPCAFLDDDWMDFLHIWYIDQVPWATDAHKIEFSIVPNLGLSGHYFRKCCVFVVIYQMG